MRFKKFLKLMIVAIKIWFLLELKLF